MTKLGFGFMRLPLIDEDDPASIDIDEVKKMVDSYISLGGSYFDTGWDYHNGKSEEAIRKAVVERYPREEILIADKIPIYSLHPNDNIEELFERQLKNCGVEYFDYYLIHSMNENHYISICNDLNIFSFIEEKKKEGKIRHIGLSHHDTAEVLDKILTEHPEMEFVQVQLNYIDWDNSIRAEKYCEVAERHGLPVTVMEPLKGGLLANIDKKAEKIFKDYDSSMSVASWGIRFASSPDVVDCVLSGMSDIKQVEDNMNSLNRFESLNMEELEIIDEAKAIINNSIEIPCSSCNYCTDYCPKNIPIPKYFSIYNDARNVEEYQKFQFANYYSNYSKRFGKASDCIKCRECESKCTQHLKISDLLVKVAEFLE